MRTIRGLTAALMMCSAVPVAAAHAQEWYAYRHDTLRTGVQPSASSLADPTKVRTLTVKWWFPPSFAGVGPFKASPIVVNDTVFIGSTCSTPPNIPCPSQDGYFYALDAASGKLKWQYPKASDPPLVGQDNQWHYGIQSSAAYWDRSPNGAVIFGAQDPSLGPFGPNGSYGSARLFALDAKFGTVIWKSDLIAEINGDTGSTGELHQKIGHSSPLIFNNKVYVGISDFSDNPLQVGKVVAVDLASGHIDVDPNTGKPTFQFQAVGTPASPPGTRGGGVWNTPASDGSGLYFTTGNTRCDSAGCQCDGVADCQVKEPKPNHGLSMVRVDPNTGNIVWTFQPVPINLDDDVDWTAGAAIMSTSCGELIASVQKDGWTYAVNAGSGTPGPPSVRWQFPPTGYPFDPNGPRDHGDDGYRQPGAAWGDVLIIKAGGENLVQDTVKANYSYLHALNACATTENTRVRWIAGIPYTSGTEDSLGAPTVTGGIVFVGTDQGYLVVLADPSVWPPIGYTCSNPDYPVDIGDGGGDHCEPHCRQVPHRLNCLQAGYAIVPIPQLLAIVRMPDGGSITGMRNEPALANGRVFVGTLNGHVYMMEP